MKSLLGFLVLLLLASYSIPSRVEVRERPPIEVELHYLMNDKLTIIQQHSVEPDTFLNMTNAVPVYYSQFYITIKTK